MLLAHKIELRPTEEQKTFFLKSCGASRFVYNSLLAHFKTDGVKWSIKEAIELFSKLRKENEWMREVSSGNTRNAVFNLENAYKRFFKNVQAGNNTGYPQFKKKGTKDSFNITDKHKFKVNGNTLRIEKLKTTINMRQHLRLTGTPKQCTISYKAGKWYASILVDCTKEPWKPINTEIRKPSVGVDLGIKSLAVLSNGVEFPALAPLKKKLKKLGKLNKKLSKQVKGSNRRELTKKRIQKLYFYVTEQRKSALHNLTDYLTRNFNKIVIEDLNVKGMVKNRKLSRAISDIGFGMFRTMLEYKAHFRDCELIVANRFFASSKICSECGQVHDMPLSKRVMICDCGNAMDRDLNAAINLQKYIPTKTSGIKRALESGKAIRNNSSLVDGANSINLNNL